MRCKHARRPVCAERGQGEASFLPGLRGVQVDKAAAPGEPPHPNHGEHIARMGRPSHLESLPDRSAFLYPCCQVAGRWAGDGDLISMADGRLDQVPYADRHAIQVT